MLSKVTTFFHIPLEIVNELMLQGFAGTEGSRGTLFGAQNKQTKTGMAAMLRKRELF